MSVLNDIASGRGRSRSVCSVQALGVTSPGGSASCSVQVARVGSTPPSPVAHVAHVQVARAHGAAMPSGRPSRWSASRSPASRSTRVQVRASTSSASRSRAWGRRRPRRVPARRPRFGRRPWLAPMPAAAGSARETSSSRAGAAAQCAAVIVSLIRVTAPLRASARPCQRDAVVHRDRRERQDVAGEHRGRPERRGAADLPEHVAGLRAVDELHAAGRRGDQRRAGLEDEDGVRIALGVQRERAGQPERRRRTP